MSRKPLTLLPHLLAALAFLVVGIALTPHAAVANTVEAVPPAGSCHITGADSCVTVPVEIDRSDTVGMRAFSVTFTLSAELVLCDGTSSITEGTYLSSLPGVLLTAFQVLDNGSGSYTADGAILGTTCGQTDDLGTLFSIAVKSTVADGTGTITITSVLLRDCANATIPPTIGPDGSVDIDKTPPTAVADLGADQVKTSNPAGETTGIDVTFTAEVGATVEVWAKGYGDYPEYVGSVPTAPTDPIDAAANGWVLTSAAASGDTVLPGSRDFWYFVVFTTDACGNKSGVSNVTGGTLNYHLGDVADGSPGGTGDNLVNTVDISRLGAHYGANVAAPGDSLNNLDVGPTTDFSVDARPTPDDILNFEDLVLYAINYFAVGAPRMAPTPAGELALYEPAVALDVSRESGLTVARLSLVDNPNHVKGVHAFLALDGLEVVSAESGSLVSAQGAPAFFATLDEAGGVWVDLALLGRGLAFEGSGEIAVLTLSGDGVAHLGDVDLRDRKNRSASRHPVDTEPASLGQTTSVQPSGLPARVELAAARPNPFGTSTEIMFRLPASAPVSLTVHDVTGRLVRTLVDRTVGAGEMSVQWDGRTNDGTLAGAGIYFYTFRTTDHRETRKLIRVN